MTFVNKENKPEYVWATSWGVSTRLMGALIMTHSDDNGLVLPPHIAPIQVVIIPIYKNADQLAAISAHVDPIINRLRELGISVKYDDAENRRPGFKFADYELKGIPVRLAIGARDIEEGTVEIMRRDTLEKHSAPLEGIAEYVATLLEEIQQGITTTRHSASRREHDTPRRHLGGNSRPKSRRADSCSHTGTEQPRLKRKSREETKATIRCIPSTATPLPALVSTPASLRHAV